MESSEDAFDKVDLAGDDSNLIVRIFDTNQRRQNKEFHVERHIIARSSTKWADFCMPDNEYEFVRVISFNGDAMSHEILFSVMYWKFENVPANPSQSQIFALLKLADEYKQIHLLRPWAAIWVKPLRNNVKSCIGRIEDLQELLYIAWISGDKILFKDVVVVFVSELVVEADRSISMDCLPLSNLDEIPGLVDYLRNEHYKKAEELCQVFERAIKPHGGPKHDDDYQKYCKCGQYHCDECGHFCKLCDHPRDERDWCDTMLIGSIVRGYEKCKLDWAQYKPTVYAICTWLQSVNYIVLPEKYSRLHDQCEPEDRINKQLDDIMDSIAKVLNEDLEQHLDRQAALTGLDSN
ncbi:hypothetical protein PG995_014788 [Apiospora arundinis]